ncbi:hypothetical protein ESY87_20260, partial [Subsaximicrobium wynnwilliamsii]|uniref:hypothetical protein n=1 Tax=Subsaximicrobium wynnwilliamsii TaxID=291179 RepID=UPI0011BE8A93
QKKPEITPCKVWIMERKVRIFAAAKNGNVGEVLYRFFCCFCWVRKGSKKKQKKSLQEWKKGFIFAPAKMRKSSDAKQEKVH